MPQPWNAFLQEVDSQLGAPIELHCLGGFVLAAVYGLPRPTGDVDYIAAIALEAGFQLTRIAGRGSALAQRHSLYFQHVTIADVPQNYEERLTELFPDRFPRLRLFALDAIDLVLPSWCATAEWIWKMRNFWTKQES